MRKLIEDLNRVCEGRSVDGSDPWTPVARDKLTAFDRATVEQVRDLEGVAEALVRMRSFLPKDSGAWNAARDAIGNVKDAVTSLKAAGRSAEKAMDDLEDVRKRMPQASDKA